MRTLIIGGFSIYYNFRRHDMDIYAAQASFFIILAIFPGILLLLNLIHLLPYTEADLIYIIHSLLPEAIVPLVTQIIEDLYSKASGTILSISVLTALWSASKGVLGVERGLNQAFEVEETRGVFVLRIISILYMIMFIFVFALSLGLLVFGNRIQLMLANKFPDIARISGYLISFRTLLAIIILIVFFMCLYTFFPSRETVFRTQLPGAIFSTFGWLLFSFVFSIYIDNFSNFSYMYGSLTAVILLMLWVYACIYILFIGAEINMVFIELKENLFFNSKKRKRSKKHAKKIGK